MPQTSIDPTYDEEPGQPRRIAYGNGPERYGFVSTPEGPAADGELRPIVILIHGGFWKQAFGFDLMTPLATDLANGHGYLVWNIEYRRVGQPGGGYPGTLEDVAAAIDYVAVLAEDYPIDLDRVAVVGHSAGGHLALWSNSRSALDQSDPGSSPVVRPALTIAQAPVADLAAAAGEGLGSDATQAFLGGEPSDVPDAYRVAQPRLDVGQIVYVHGSDDVNVPPSQSIEAAAAGGELVLLADTDHFDVIDPTSLAWSEIVARLNVWRDS